MPNPPRDAKVTYRVEFKNNLMARRTAVTDYSCICTNNPEMALQNGKGTLPHGFTLAFLHDEGRKGVDSWKPFLRSAWRSNSACRAFPLCPAFVSAYLAYSAV